VSIRAGRALIIALGGVALALATVVWFSHPICRPVSDAEVVEFEQYGALATRTDRQWHGKIWQKRDGHWYHCKSWISRKLFF
jgi:hypothetical protein